MASRTGEGLLGVEKVSQCAKVVAKWALFGGGPPNKPPGPTLDQGLIAPLGWGFSDEIFFGLASKSL